MGDSCECEAVFVWRWTVSVFELLLLTQRGHEGYSRSASDASPSKTSDPFPPLNPPTSWWDSVLYEDWGHVFNKHNVLDGDGRDCDGGDGLDLDGGGGGEGLSSNNSNDLRLVGSKDRKDPEVPAEDIFGWGCGPKVVPLDISTLYAEYTWPGPSRLRGVAEKDFGGEHAKQVTDNNLIMDHSSYNIHFSSSESDGEETVSSESNGFETISGSIVSINEGNREFKSHVPEIGMSFSCEQEAHKLYQKYATEMGFKVRKGKVQRFSNGSLKKRYFFCSQEGYRSKKQPTKKTTYTRKETRTGCNARIQIRFENERFRISEFVSDHNHDLQGSTQRRYIDPNSNTSEIDSLIQPIHEIGTTKETEAGFCDLNYSKHLRVKQMNSLQPEDAQGEAMTLPEYVQKYEKAAEQQRREELDEDFRFNAIEKSLKIADRYLDIGLKKVEDVLKEGSECLDTKAPEIYVHKKSGVAGPIKETYHDQEETSKRSMECQIQKKHKHN
ncbi:protein FAR1-RELATED SEQUENCE 9-like [Fagus crenata]